MNTKQKLEVIYENINKVFYLCRGVPSSGKSTTIKRLVNPEHIFSADKFFEKGGVYNFDRNMLGVAHQQCKAGIENVMARGVSPVACDNTNTTIKECRPYIELAKQYGYTIKIVESDRPEWVYTSKLLEDKVTNREELEKMSVFFYEDNKKSHNVPRETIMAMFQRWVPSKEIQKLL